MTLDLTTCIRLDRRPIRGFTLLELLAVMAIILILAGLIVGAAGHVWRKSQEKGTEAVISILATALEKFNADHGVYPNKDGSYGSIPAHIPNTETAYDIRNLYYRLRNSGCLKQRIDSRYLTKVTSPPDTLRGDDSDCVVNDAWGNPIVYRLPRDAADGHFDLWSMGLDGQDSRPAKTSTIDPTDVSDSKNADNIVWSAGERR